jgi:hypothetical protein
MSKEDHVISKPSAEQVSGHIQMSRMLSEDKFLELQRHNCLPMEVMLEPLVCWFSEEGCNYPVGALKWARDFVEGDTVIYSSVFHQTYTSAGRHNDRNVKSGSLGLVSVITITVSKVGINGKEVRVEMSVGHDKVMIITEEKLLLKDKHSNKVFEVWINKSVNGLHVWSKSGTLETIPSENFIEHPPTFLDSFAQRMILFVSDRLKCSALDLTVQKDAMNRLVGNAISNRKIPTGYRTPRHLENWYYETVKNINTILKDCSITSIVNGRIEDEFIAFTDTFKNYLDRNPEIFIPVLSIETVKTVS